MAKEYSKYLRDTIKEYGEANTFFKRILRKDSIIQNVQSTLQKIVNENRMFLHLLHFELENIYLPFPIFESNANKNPLLNSKNRVKPIYQDLVDEMYRRADRVKEVKYKIYDNYAEYMECTDYRKILQTIEDDIAVSFDYIGDELFIAVYIGPISLEILDNNKEQVMKLLLQSEMVNIAINKTKFDISTIWDDIRKKVKNNEEKRDTVI